MRFALAILGLSLAGTMNAAAIDVRPATEDEILAELLGCWDREPTFAGVQNRQNGQIMEQSMCFDTSNQVLMYEAAGSMQGGLHGVDGGGAFQVTGGKLLLDGEPEGAWLFSADQLECDVILNPRRALKLTNCVGLDAGEAITDTSYEFRDVAERAATADEMNAILTGCWAYVLEHVPDGIVIESTSSKCFDGKEILQSQTSWPSQNRTVRVGAKYHFESGRLVMTSTSLSDGWGWTWTTVSCDVRLRPDARIAFSDCLGSGLAMGDEEDAPRQPDSAWERMP